MLQHFNYPNVFSQIGQFLDNWLVDDCITLTLCQVYYAALGLQRPSLKDMDQKLMQYQ